MYTTPHETVALVGKYDAVGKDILYNRLSRDFTIKEIASEDSYAELSDAQYVILRTLRMGSQIIDDNPQLKLIQRWGVGFDTVDIETAGKHNVQVAITYGVNSIPVAEYTVLLMLSVMRHLLRINRNVLDGRWQDIALFESSYVVHGKIAGLVGLGAIGRHVARILKKMGAQIYYYDVMRADESVEAELGATFLPFEELVKKVDILSFHVPLTEKTRHLLNREILAAMKPNAVIINTSRGGIIDEEDLYEALKNKKILGAALDVFEHEPVDRNNKLLTLDNIVVSAHSAGNTADNSINMANICADNIYKVRNGEMLSPPVLVNARFMSHG